MSQSFIDDQLDELRTSTQELMQNPSIENVMQMMKENFQKVFDILTFIINGNALQHSILMRLMNNDAPQAVDLLQTYITAAVNMQVKGEEEEEKHPVATTSVYARSVSSTSIVSSRQSSSSRHSTSESKEMICYDCGKVFIRGSLTDSISKHAKETHCKPFICSVCAKLFKDVSYFDKFTVFLFTKCIFQASSRSKHEKTHDTQNKRPNKAVADEPEAKRIKIAATKEDITASQNLFSTIKTAMAVESEDDSD